MANMYAKHLVVFGLLGLGLSGCKPADPPPDLLKTQREALDKAKTLNGEIQQQAKDKIKADEDASK